MTFWQDQSIFVLEDKLNETSGQLGLATRFNSFDARMTHLKSTGLVYNFCSCQCSSEVYETFDPESGTVCSWSIMISLLTGEEDPRFSIFANPLFEAYSLNCHALYGPPNIEDGGFDVFAAFTDMSKVVVLLVRVNIYF